MKSIVFVFVPFDGSQQELDHRLRDCLRALDPPEPGGAAPSPAAGPAAPQAEPFWTWFLPNPLPEPKSAGS